MVFVFVLIFSFSSPQAIAQWQQQKQQWQLGRCLKLQGRDCIFAQRSCGCKSIWRIPIAFFSLPIFFYRFAPEFYTVIGSTWESQGNKTPAFQLENQEERLLGTAKCWRDCSEEAAQGSNPIKLCMNLWVTPELHMHGYYP